MKELIFLLYETATAVIPGVIFLLILKRRGKIQPGIVNYLLLAAFMVYICGAFHYTGTGTLGDGLRLGVDLSPDGVNLRPFSQEINPIGYALNVILLVPMGFLGAALMGGGLAQAVCRGFGLSLLIELSQLCNHRSFDIDDLTCNTAGAAAGYLIYKLFAAIFKLKPIGQKHVWGLVLCMFFGRFLLYNSYAMASRLYGF